MNLLLKSSLINHSSSLEITGSKSETNRLLLLQGLYPNIIVENISHSDDSLVMQEALQTINQQPSPINQINIHHAGTAMRFLTAYFAIQEEREVVLTGSSRMKERPIKILVDALRDLGADITYEEKEGFPPIKIKGKKLTQNRVSLDANISSQYISALLLIAPKLQNGIEITLKGNITSIPYIKMTLHLLNQIGVDTSFIGNEIKVLPKYSIQNSQVTIESDWSSASYFYAIIALSALGTEITLSKYKKDSLQGDSCIAEIYKNFGVETFYNRDNTILIRKINHPNLATLNLQLNDCPDIAQTIAVTCFGLGIGCYLTGLHTLKIKETDRLEAMKNELSKLGASVSVTPDSITLASSKGIYDSIKIKTYQDHRMAMAFAPLALKTNIIIEEAEVVSKSYPTFWEDLKKIGFLLEEK
jgi:3-phosphoshikimate 1-carboxyvinyltransferase